MPTNPVTAIKYLLLLFGLLIFGLLVFAPKEKAHGQTPNPSTVGNSATICVDTTNEDHEVEFDFRLTRENGADPGTFRLEDGDSNCREFDELADDTYVITWAKEAGWQIANLRCRGADSIDREMDEDTGRVLQYFTGDGDHLLCTYEFEPEPTATATSTRTPTVTPTPEPTVAPAPQTREVGCADGSVKVVPVSFTGVVCQAIQPTTVPTVAPVLTTVPQGSVRITAPNTGDAGLLN